MDGWTTKVIYSYCGKGVIRKNLLKDSIRVKKSFLGTQMNDKKLDEFRVLP